MFHPQDLGRQAYWQRTTFKPEEWWRIRWHAKAAGLKYGISCFSEYAARQQAAMQPDFWKMPGAQTCLPVTESRKLRVDSYARCHAPWETTPDCWQIVREPKYPTHRDETGADTVDGVHCVGLSCHCPEIGPGVQAARRGAWYIEYHVCWDRRQFGPDTTSSITIDELAEMVRRIAQCAESQ